MCHSLVAMIRLDGVMIASVMIAFAKSALFIRLQLYLSS